AEEASAQGDNPQGFTTLEQDHDNLRAALRWARDNDKRTLGLRLARGLWYFWRRRGHLNEGRQWLAELLRLKNPSPDDAPRDVTDVKATTWLAVDEHDFDVAVTLFEQNDALQRVLGSETVGLADIVNIEARQARAEGNYARATTLVQEKLGQYRAAIKQGALAPSAAAHLLQELGTLNREQGNYAESSRYWQEDLELQRSLHDEEGVAVALLGLSDVARDKGDAAEIRKYGEECLSIFRKTKNLQGLGFTLNNLALAAYLDDDFAKAAPFAEESVAVFRKIKGGVSLSEVLITLGRIRMAQGETDKARAHFREALELAWNEGPRWLVLWALEVLGWFLAARDEAEEAVKLLAVAFVQRQSVRSPLRQADLLHHEEALRSVREILSEEKFESIWKQTASMTLREAITTMFEQSYPPKANVS
ncbi:MAG: tetratricopeptide repeat protein, partial [Trueperaceae bacterium]